VDAVTSDHGCMLAHQRGVSSARRWGGATAVRADTTLVKCR